MPSISRTPCLRRLLLLFLAVSGSAQACPYCDSETGREVAAGIFNQSFGIHFLLTLLPFPLLLLIVALIHFGLPRVRRGEPPSSSS